MPARCAECGGREWAPAGVCPTCKTFPTLGYQVADLIESACVIPDGERAGEAFLLTDEQLRFLLHFYRLDPLTGRFTWFRGAQLVRPQKWGKGPFSASIVIAEAHPDGPVLFDGWDAAGEPVGRPWPTPWIQITAASEDQTDNVWRALQPMVEMSPTLAAEIPDTGQTRINLHGGGRIEPVTSSARSRLGARVTFCLQDEALALDTPLPTPDGWSTVGDIAPGDRLIGADGHPCNVIRKTPVQTGRRCYRVTTADGASVIASDGHLWLTRLAGSAALPRIRTTGEMFTDGRRFRIPAPGPYDLPDADLPLDPYLLGLWLGDGSTGQQYITSSADDAPTIQKILADRGILVRVMHPPRRAARIALSNGNGYQSSLRPPWAKALQALPCYRHKHIPPEYFRGSIRQRVDLLRGLMDSDGHCGRDGHCTFVGNEQLSADVLALLRTLGQVARRVWRADARSRSGGTWKVNFKPRGGLQPFLMPRKAQRVCGRSSEREAAWVSVARIEPVDSVPVQCVEVDSPDHLFLAGASGMVTHNTHSWLESNGGRRLADTQRRNLAGMRGRWLETTNAWDPAEESVAQQTAEGDEPGVYRDDVEPGAGSVRNARDRRRLIRQVYGDSLQTRENPQGWIDLERIEGEILSLLDRDPAQAERFFLNRKEAGESIAFNIERWDSLATEHEAEAGALIVVGVDGARSRDALAMVATEVQTGHQWPLGIWERPDDAPPDYEHDRDAIDHAMRDAMRRWSVWRVYVDPQHIEALLDRWQGRWGKDRIIPWYTARARQIAWAVRSFTEAINAGDLSHDGDPVLREHIRNARRMRLNVRDDKGVAMHSIQKDRSHSPRKMDGAMAAVLSWEARGDAIAAGATAKKRSRRLVAW